VKHNGRSDKLFFREDDVVYCNVRGHVGFMLLIMLL